MPNRKSSPTVALIQVRERPDVEAHEQDCIRRVAGLDDDQLRSFNALQNTRLTTSDIDGDIVLIGGAGALSVTEPGPHTEPLRRIVLDLVEQRRPTLGLCWGHQFIAWALGGDVVTDESRSEVGAFDVALTETGAADPLLEDLPNRFPTLMGHNDLVQRLPQGVAELASSDRCRNQMIRVGDTPIYGAQFHVELTPRSIRERLLVYQAQYLRDQPPLNEDDDPRLRDTPEANTILRRFIENMA